MCNAGATAVLKRELRKRICHSLSSLPQSALQAESAHVCATVIIDRRWRSARTVAIYASMRAELDTDVLLSNAFNSGKRVFLPRVMCKRTRSMRMLETYSMQDLNSWTPNAWGIREPPVDENRDEAPQNVSLDVLIMPGLAFDVQGRRCGRGAGFYDAFLTRYKQSRSQMPYTIAPALAVQMVPVVPVAPHDVPVDKVITTATVADQ